MVGKVLRKQMLTTCSRTGGGTGDNTSTIIKTTRVIAAGTITATPVATGVTGL